MSDALPSWYDEQLEARDLAEMRRTGLTVEQLTHLRWMAQGPLLTMEVARLGRRLTPEERATVLGPLMGGGIEDAVAWLTHEQREAIRSWGWPYPK